MKRKSSGLKAQIRGIKQAVHANQQWERIGRFLQVRQLLEEYSQTWFEARSQPYQRGSEGTSDQTQFDEQVACVEKALGELVPEDRREDLKTHATRWTREISEVHRIDNPRGQAELKLRFLAILCLDTMSEQGRKPLPEWGQAIVAARREFWSAVKKWKA